MNPERRYTPQEPQFNVILIAKTFFRKDFLPTQLGFKQALAALNEQHERTLPSQEVRHTMQEAVLHEDPVIEQTEQGVLAALADDNYEAVVSGLNMLHAYGETDTMDELGGKAFNRSLNAHRTVFEQINRKFMNGDPYLRTSGTQAILEAVRARVIGNIREEHRLLRGNIHLVLLNGTLGEKARQQFDPLAIIQLS